MIWCQIMTMGERATENLEEGEVVEVADTPVRDRIIEALRVTEV